MKKKNIERKGADKEMKIDSNRLRQELNKCFCEMGYIQKSDVLKVIEKLEKEERENSEFYQFLEKL